MLRHSIGHRGRRIRYLEAQGRGPRPGRVVVLLHAFPLSADMWEPQLAAVPPGWRFLAPDLRGFGEPDPGGVPDVAQASVPAACATPSIDDYGEDVLALLDALGLREAVIGGLSMGGYAAFSVMRLDPRRVSGLVLADTRAEADGESTRAARDAMIQALDQGGAPAVFERMHEGLLGRTSRTSRPWIVEHVQRLALAQRPHAIRHAIERLKSRPDSTPLLPGIACPVQVIVGEEDQITPPATARAMQEQIPGSHLTVVPRAGHLSNLENADAFNEALHGFLRIL